MAQAEEAEREDADKPPLTPIQLEIQELREQKKKLSERIEALNGQKKLVKVFQKKVTRLTERYQLDPAAVAKLELAAKGVIVRTSRKAEELPWREDVPEWLDGWQAEYLFRDGETVYFGEDPAVFFARNSNVWKNAVQSVLSPEQLQQRQMDSEQRKKFQIQATAANCTAEVDQWLKLSPKQRTQVQELYVDFIESSGIHCQYDFLMYLTQLREETQISLEELEKILTPEQYEKWGRRMDQ